jgi:hypothetical protein
VLVALVLQTLELDTALYTEMDASAGHPETLAVDEVLHAAVSGSYSGFLVKLWHQLRLVFPQRTPWETHSHLDIGPFGVQAQDLARRLVRWHGGGLRCERGPVRGAFRICCSDEAYEETMLLELEDLIEGRTVMAAATVLERASMTDAKGDSVKRGSCGAKSTCEANVAKDTLPPAATAATPTNPFRILKRTAPLSQQSPQEERPQPQLSSHNPAHQLSDLKSEQYERARAEIFKDHRPEEDEEEEDSVCKGEGEKEKTVTSSLSAHAVPFVPMQPLGHVLRFLGDVVSFEEAARIAGQWHCCLRLRSLSTKPSEDSGRAAFSALAVFPNAQAASAALCMHPNSLARLSVRLYH